MKKNIKNSQSIFLTTILFSFLTLFPLITYSQAAIFGDKVASEKFNLSMEIGVPLANYSNT